MTIQVVSSPAPANYPFAVQYQNVFGNWCTIQAYLTEPEAQRAGVAYISQGSNCGRPLRIEHCAGGSITPR